MAEPSATPPRWFIVARSVVIALYLGVAGACLLASFGMMMIGTVVYRDSTSYSLAGNPWKESSFPWYEIDTMRVLSVFAVLLSVGFGFIFANFLFRFLSARIVLADPNAEAVRRIICAALALLVVFGAAAWFGRWFG